MYFVQVGRSSPLKYSQSINDLSHIPERDKWNSPSRKQGNPPNSPASNCFCITHDNVNQNPTNDTNNLRDSAQTSTSDLQLCECYMRDILRNTTHISSSAFASDIEHKITKSPEKIHPDYIRPRKLQLDKTLAKYKLHKSLPVSPVSEECRLSDFVQENAANSNEFGGRGSFSYFLDVEGKSDTSSDFKQVCSDIEKFSFNSNKEYDQIANWSMKPKRETAETKDEEEDGSFSSDSLEDNSFLSVGTKKLKNSLPPRRCVSNNELYKFQMEESNENFETEMQRSESFYLNQNIKNSQDSILSDENNLEIDDFPVRAKSYCNSLESVLSNESECKSAPLEILFSSQRQTQYSELTNKYYESCTTTNAHFSTVYSPSVQFYNYGGSLPKNYESGFDNTSYIHPGMTANSIKHSQSLYINPQTESPAKPILKTSQTQTDLNFETPEEIVLRKKTASADFQQKLLKFETCIAQNVNTEKGIAFFVNAERKKNTKCVKLKQNTENVENQGVQKKSNETTEKTKSVSVLGTQNSRQSCTMYIPSLQSKNKQYNSRYCNILNNKPESNLEIFETGNKSNKGNNSLTVKNFNFEKNTNCNQVQQTSSLDRHLFTKSLLDSEKVCHKPPKAIRRHSSKIRRTKTSYEYIKKDDFYKDSKKLKREILNNCLGVENTIELSYKEKNIEKDLEMSNRYPGNSNILNDLYDSLEKPASTTKMELDSLEVNINSEEPETYCYDSLEVDPVNIWTKNNVKANSNFARFNRNLNASKTPTHEENISEFDKIQVAVENIKILNEIQRRIQKINDLVEIFKTNVRSGRVRKLSSMYENLTNSHSCYNDLGKPHTRFRRRNLSLPNFVERRLNFESTPSSSQTTISNKKMESSVSRLREKESKIKDGTGD